MYQAKREKDIRCPIKYWQDIFDGKWKVCIVCVLEKKSRLRYGMIKEVIGDITDTVLSGSLKDLVDAGIVERTQYDEIPIRVEYSLTERGRSVVPVFAGICQWAREDYLKIRENTIRCENECEYLL